jgi:hypothetical protein
MDAYIWHEELGEPPRAKSKITGKIVELDQLPLGTLIEFPEFHIDSYETTEFIGGRLLITEKPPVHVARTLEVVSEGGIWPNLYYLDTIRRAWDNIGIELVNRGQAGRNRVGTPYHTIKGPDDALDRFLTKGDGYRMADELLRKHGL